eukprot:509083_1
MLYHDALQHGIFPTVISFEILRIHAKFIHPRFDHIKTNPFLHYKIVDISCGMIHAILIILLCIVFYDVLLLNVTQNVIDSLTTFEERAIASVAIGYFISDMIVSDCYFSCKHTGSPDYMLILHHIVSLSGVIVCVITVCGGKLIVTSVFLSEISTPLLLGNSLRNKFVRRDDARNMSKVFVANNIAIKLVYIIIYSITRFILIPILVIPIIFVFECSVYIQIIGALFIVLCVILIFFSFQNLNKTYEKYKNIQNSNTTKQATCTVNPHA